MNVFSITGRVDLSPDNFLCITACGNNLLAFLAVINTCGNSIPEIINVITQHVDVSSAFIRLITKRGNIRLFFSLPVNMSVYIPTAFRSVINTCSNNAKDVRLPIYMRGSEKIRAGCNYPLHSCPSPLIIDT